MRLFKVALISVLVCVLVMSSALTSFGADTTNIIQATSSNMDQILSDNGFDDEQIELMDDDDKLNTAEKLLINPDLVQNDSTVLEINEFELIEKIVNTPNEELIKQGFDEDFLEKFNERLDFWNASSDEDLMEIYNRDISDIQLLRLAYKSKESFDIKEITSTKVTSSGSIAATQLYFAQTCNKSTRCDGKLSYRVIWTFKWHKLPFMDMLTDEIAVAWGGGLYTENPTSDYTYCYLNGNTTHYSAHYVEGPVDAGYRFWTHQANSDWNVPYNQLWKGTAALTLVQNGSRQGKKTKVISQYGHGVFCPGSISISPSPSISFSSGWDYSEQERTSIDY